MIDGAVYRILDASLNRANEGLRTVEDHARFVLDAPKWTEQLKQLRHGLAAAAATLDRACLLANRDTENDCGTVITTSAERSRASTADVAAAAFSRVQQSLRSLEEYGKLVSPEMAGQFEQLRYLSYTLEKDLVTSTNRRAAIEHAHLYLLVDLQGEEDIWLERLARLAAAGADVIQIRDKHADDRTLWQRCQLAAELLCLSESAKATPNRCRLIINDRADIAAAVDADGVHVGQEELPVKVVRQIIGADKLIGLSTHSMKQVREAVECEADYIGCGPTFRSGTKHFQDFVGVQLAAEASRDFQLPTFAIGGIDRENVAELLAVGVKRVAVGAAVWGRDYEVRRCGELADLIRREG